MLKKPWRTKWKKNNGKQNKERLLGTARPTSNGSCKISQSSSSLPEKNPHPPNQRTGLALRNNRFFVGVEVLQSFTRALCYTEGCVLGEMCLHPRTPVYELGKIAQEA